MIVSPAELQDKTALFIQGKIDAKSFYFVLKSAFGDKLSFVLPGMCLFFSFQPLILSYLRHM